MKIGFLAMSGIRVCDPELAALGLTLPAFVDRGKVIASLPSLGLLYLAAVTPAEHEVAYYEAASDGSEPQAIYDCDLVAISTFSAQAFEAYAIADRLRAHGVITAMGGLHVSVLPEEARTHADHVIIGEGERVWPLVVKAVEERQPARIWRASEYPPLVISALPVPRYDLLHGREYNRYTVQTTRGCPWRCEFCASNVMLGLPYRKRPVSAVIRDINAIAAIQKRPFVEFADDNTFVDKRWGLELCRSLRDLRVKWFTETDISVADDDDLLRAMAESGCKQVLIGLESPSRGAITGLEQRYDFKAKRFDRYLDSIQRIQAAGITVNGCFVLGLDNQGPDVFEQVYDFVKQSRLYEVQITVLTPFPGTPLYHRLARESRLLAAGAWDRCTLFDVNFTPQHMSVDELRAGFRTLTAQLYQSDFVAERRQSFFKNIRNANHDNRRGHVLAV